MQTTKRPKGRWADANIPNAPIPSDGKGRRVFMFPMEVQEMRTASRRQVTVTLSFRVPLPMYEQVTTQAEREGIRLSDVLRRVFSRGLEIEQSYAVMGANDRRTDAA
jgi:hypothetical protein